MENEPVLVDLQSYEVLNDQTASQCKWRHTSERLHKANMLDVAYMKSFGIFG